MVRQFDPNMAHRQLTRCFQGTIINICEIFFDINICYTLKILELILDQISLYVENNLNVLSLDLRQDSVTKLKLS